MKTHPDYPYHSPNQYLVDVIESKKLIPLKLNDNRIIPLLNILNEWGGRNLTQIKISGSTAKGTCLQGKADLDLFLSLRESTNGTLEEIYNSLFNHINHHKVKLRMWVRKQNVSVRVFYKGFKIDIVPGKKQPGFRNWHNIFVRREEKDRTMTNIDEHITIISSSGRLDEIMALKIWRDVHSLDFPSIYLELLILDVLKGKRSGKTYLARNVINVLEFISSYILSKAVYDPINGSNVISQTLNKTEKRKIQSTAERSLSKKYLSEIIW